MRRRPFQLGEWRVDPRSCSLRHQDAAADIPLEPRAMDVLVTLCDGGRLLSADDLLRLCWDGINVGENQVHKAIAQLRRALRDSATQPRYIENIRKRGYRIVAAVTPLPEGDAGEADEKWLVEAPFVGLDPFGPGHATVFFGREAATAQLLKAVSARAAGPQALLIVLGPSGSGKTSLVQAGLLPALARGAAALDVSASAVLDLGDAGNLPWPLLLGGALMDMERAGEPLFAGHSADSLGNILADGGPIPANGAAGGGARFVLFIDRLEALFAAPVPQETLRRPFLAALDRLSRSGRAIIIAACRNDFYPDLAREPVLMEGKAAGGHFDLAPPSRAEIAQMIRLPAQAAGLRFAWDPESERGLDDLLCERAAGSPDALPLLQYTLQQLYLPAARRAN